MCDFIAGHYTATWNAIALGQLKPDEGLRSSTQDMAEEVKGDALGQTTQDLIYMGSEHSIAFTLIEYAKGVTAKVFHPWTSTAGQLGPVGSMAACGEFAKPLVMTAVGGTAYSEGAPASRTYRLTILAPGFPVDIAFKPGLREMPIRLKALPKLNVSVYEFYTET